MPYNFTPPEAPKSDNRMFEIGARIGSDVMDYRLKKQVISEERKQRELDAATERLHAQELMAIGSTFPAQGTPEEQNQWLGKYSSQLTPFKGGPQLLNTLQQVTDNNFNNLYNVAMRSTAAKMLADKVEAAQRFGGDMTLLNKSRGIEELRTELQKMKMPLAPIPPDLFDANGYIDPAKKYEWLAKMQRDQPEERMLSWELPGGRVAVSRPGSEALHILETDKISPIDQESLRSLNIELRGVRSALDKIPHTPGGPLTPEREALLRRRNDLENQRDTLLQRLTPTQVTPATASSTTPLTDAEKSDALQRARDSIAKGAPREAVIKRLQEFGITEEP